MDSGYELFDHTADIGIRVWAPTRASLIAPATDGLYAALGELVLRQSRDDHTITRTADDAALLLHDYLSELLHLFDVRQACLSGVRVEDYTDTRLVVHGALAALDQERSQLAGEIKAITYHELTVRPTEHGFEATYIVDV